MKLNQKNFPILLRLLILCTLIGTLGWAVVERLLALVGLDIDLTAGPIGFDIEVIAVSVTVNPGTLLGIIPAVRLFRSA
jgi:hypothetical protein